MKTITKVYKVYEFDELSQEAKDKVIEKLRYINVEDFDWWEDDGLLELTPEQAKKAHITDAEYKTEIFRFKKIYFDLDRAHYIQFPDLQVNNEVAFYKWLGIPKRLQNKIDTYNFDSAYKQGNTSIEFYTGEKTTDSEDHILTNAEDKFSDWMEEALRRLQANYDYLTSDESIIETIEANDYHFLEDGTMANCL